MLYFVGMGLYSENSVTLEGLQAIQQCSTVFLEAYTSVLGVDKEKLEQAFNVEITLADRELVEQKAEKEILERVLNGESVAFLVVGDPFGATTHSDLHLRAVHRGIKVRVIHNASIMNACACVGLQLYNFGQCISITFFAENQSYMPRSTYDKIQKNVVNKFHTLCLLDIKVKEQTDINLLKGNDIYEPPRFMSVQVAASQLLQMEAEFQQGVCTPESAAFGLARVGHEDQVICSGTLQQLADGLGDFGGPLHSLILASDMHPEEQVWFDLYNINKK